MNLVPHIDVIGDDRIQQFMEDADNIVLRTPHAELLENWIPDVGQCYQPYRCLHGVYRSRALSEAEVPAVLQHRWFEQSDRDAVMGMKYMGLVIYDSEGDDATFEFVEGSEEFGAIKPTRHDNRRHLIVTTVPMEIQHGAIPLTVRALGKGRCYLESVLLMLKCPEPSSFAPEIKNLSVSTAQKTPDGLTVEVNFITTEPATATVNVTATDGTGGKIEKSTKALYPFHTVSFEGLKPDTSYTTHIIAKEIEGATAEKTVDFDTTIRSLPREKEVTVPLEIIDIDGKVALPETSLPLTFGVPVVEGMINEPKSCVLNCGDTETDAQTRVHSRWPDGSARWVLVDVPCPADLGKRKGQVVKAEVQLHPEKTTDIDRLTCEVSQDRIVVTGQMLRVSVGRNDVFPAQIERLAADGVWRTVFGEKSGALTGNLGNGLKLKNGSVENLKLEESGPERAVIRYDIPIADEYDTVHFKSTIRIHIFTRHPFVKLVNQLVVVSPVLAPAVMGSSLPDMTQGMKHAQEAVVGFEGEATSLLQLDSMVLNLPYGGTQEVRLGDTVYQLSEGVDWRIVHENDLSHRIETGGEGKTTEGHLNGHLLLTGDKGSLAVGLKNFWQTYPKGIHIGSEAAKIELFPKLSKEEPPNYAEEWHRLYFWYDPDKAQYKVKVGTAFTAEILLGFPETSDEKEKSTSWLHWLERPPVVRPELDYLNGTGALLNIASKHDSLYPEYEKMMDRAVDEQLDEIAKRRFFGFMNFGDGYSGEAKEGGTWNNNEYDSPFCYYNEFLRGGDPRWFFLGSQTARHMTDIDTCNYSRDPEQVGGQYMHIPGHMGGFLPPFFRYKMGGSTQTPSHMWAEGPVLHYLLTGDESMRETMEETGEWLRRGFYNFDIKNSRECGWHLIHLCGLMRMDSNPRYLNAAAFLVEKILEKQVPGGGWERPLTESHCQCPIPREYGEAGFMIGILLAGLRRYYALEKDPRVADAIVGGVRWLIKSTYVPDVGHFRYTNCPNRGATPTPQHAIQIFEGLVEAYNISKDPEILTIIRKNLDAIGVVNSSCLEIRYIPLILYSIGQLSKGDSVSRKAKRKIKKRR